MTVPPSEVTLQIASDSLHLLPGGASYTAHSGQARVSVSRKEATATEPEHIVIYASCDSLMLLCEEYEQTIWTLRNNMMWMAGQTSELHSQEDVKEKPPNGIGTALKWYLAGLLSGMIGTIIIFIKLKK